MIPSGNFHVVTDSMADLPVDYPVSIPFAPVRIHVDGKEYLSKRTITTEDVLRFIREGKKIETAGASVKGFVDAISSLPPNKPILVITMSSKLSGAYNAALSAARLLKPKGYQVHVFDSFAGSIAEGLLVSKAVELAEETDAESALSKLEKLRDRLRLFMTVRDLTYLARSGRVGWAKAMLGKLLGVYPIITLRDGELVLYRNIRGLENVFTFMRKAVSGKEAFVGSVNDPEVYEKIDPSAPRCGVSPGITAHVGPGAFGVAYLE